MCQSRKSCPSTEDRFISVGGRTALFPPALVVRVAEGTACFTFFLCTVAEGDVSTCEDPAFFGGGVRTGGCFLFFQARRFHVAARKAKKKKKLRLEGGPKEEKILLPTKETPHGAKTQRDGLREEGASRWRVVQFGRHEAWVAHFH